MGYEAFTLEVAEGVGHVRLTQSGRGNPFDAAFLDEVSLLATECDEDDAIRCVLIEAEGRFFSVRGPSITPRPPQGQPIVAALGHAPVPYGLIARSADVGFVTPHDAADAERIVGEIRTDREVHVFGDLVVFLDGTEAAHSQGHFADGGEDFADVGGESGLVLE